MPVITPEATPDLIPMHADRRYEQVDARCDALRQRLAVLETRREARPDPTAGWQRLLEDPTAEIPPPPAPRNVTAEIAAVRRALEAAEQQRVAVVGEVSCEVAARLRPAQTARARQLTSAIETALEVVTAELALHRDVQRAGYTSGPLRSFTNIADRDALARLLERIRGAAQ